jgi:hypothetical protein
MNRHGLLRYVCPLPEGCQGVTIGSFSSARSNVLTDLDLISFTVHRHFDDVVDIFIWSSYLRAVEVSGIAHFHCKSSNIGQIASYSTFQ